MKRRLITSALPYINNEPHLGNLIQVLSADAFARFCRLRGYQTLYICGTDEYGTATETRAAAEGISPQELCDRYYQIHSQIYQWFTIAFDKFGRTSTPIQQEIVQDIFNKLDERGYITENTVQQLYCTTCDRFLADRYIRGTCPACGYTQARGDQCELCGKLLDPMDLLDSRCATCGGSPQSRDTKHLYLDLPKLQGMLLEWLKEASVNGFWAHNALQMTQAWINAGLRERAITRDLKWGIPVPKKGYEQKVFYVWFDACIGYISITGNYGAEKTGDWRQFVAEWWKNPEEVELFQFIGKDNIPFHTVIFPSSLLGSGDTWTMLHHMSSTEYLNYESGKFSKSMGIGVFGRDVQETGIGPDIWRFYIFYNRPEKADAQFTWKDFQEKVNSQLIGNLGNLVNRTLSFVSRYYDGKIPLAAAAPQAGSASHPGDIPFWAAVHRYEREITEKLERAELRDAFHLMFELSSFANKTFQDGEPWKTRISDPPAAQALIGNLCYVVRDLAILIEPFMPNAAVRILSFFGLSFGARDASGIPLPGAPEALSWADLGHIQGLAEVRSTEILFSRLEDDLIEQLKERYAGSQQERSAEEPLGAQNADPQTASPKEIADRFTELLDLRVAQIIGIEKHPNADNLYIETVEIAGEERVIVSGLAQHYTEAELLNKRIILAYNLRPAKLRGVLSRGMLLAASAEGPDGTELVDVLDAGDIPTGTRVQLADAAGALRSASQEELPEISIDEFLSVPLLVKGYAVYAGDCPLSLQGNPVQTGKIDNGVVR